MYCQSVFRIRRIHDDVLPVNRRALVKAQALLRERFPGAAARTIDHLAEALHDPLAHRLRTVVLVAETRQGLRGCAVLMYAPDLAFCYLDYIATTAADRGRGIGGALFERAREECLSLNALGLFFECAPDEPGAASTPALTAENAARLRFYETYGARPIIHTAYETPMQPGGLDAPHLVYDDLGTGRALRRDELRDIVRAILERKYDWLCPPAYVEMVVNSVVDDPVALRAPRYTTDPTRARARASGRRIALVTHDRHEPHHIRERGYVEAPARVPAIRSELLRLANIDLLAPEDFPDEHIKQVHDPELVEYLRTVCAAVPEGESVYPYVFPIRNATRPPLALDMRAGYYCIDTFTPLNRGAWIAARRAVDCTLTAAKALGRGYGLAYALVRPPGHHAERRVFGGFCYLNNAAIAAHMLAADGKVAILDVDYHHGNGQQMIFYDRPDVFTVSIHGDPSIAYPYFSGFADELGAGPGLGANLNLPLPEHATNVEYTAALGQALTAIRGFSPRVLVVCLGLDTAGGDPTGSWNLGSAEFEAMGVAIAALDLPTLVVQEGGYNRKKLGVHARHFFHGLSAARR